MGKDTTVVDVFRACTAAIREGKLIRRESRQDKEFHFQNWLRDRLTESGLPFDAVGRNVYPDFRIVQLAEGYEVKGLAYPGREVNYDCNSQVPTGTLTAGPSSTCSGGTPRNRMATSTRSWIW